MSTTEPATHSAFWKWSVCGLLLLATMVNYMDRLTLNQAAKPIKNEFKLDQRQYARIEVCFGIAFAAGAVFSGILVDRGIVRWYYPLMVFLWSMAGCLTGFVRDYTELLVCRFLLGFFEAANWPCALYVTSRILPSAQRTMGNGILQSGAAFGAILTPLLMIPFVGGPEPPWRIPFWLVGAVGALWVVLWLAFVRRDAIPRRAPGPEPTGQASTMADVFADRRFWVLAFVVVAINATWHFFRVWMPLLLIEEHQYSPEFTAGFTSAYYVSTDVGSWCAGLLTLLLVRLKFTVHQSRMTTFLFCASLCLLTIGAAVAPKGWGLLVMLLVIGFGALGVFPNYYSFTQELASKHQGKVTGTLGCICWIGMAILKEGEGFVLQKWGYTVGVALAGIPPCLAFLVLFFFWRRSTQAASVTAPVPVPGTSPTSPTALPEAVK